jgi:DNA ligase (NAD+)
MPNLSPVQAQSEKLIKDLPQFSADELEYWVRHHNEAYFAKAAPEISDEAFDKLVETLRMVKPDAAVLEELGERPAEKSLVHKESMLSLDKCYDDETFQKWREKVVGPLVAMPKIDGVACSLHYDAKGHLALGLTRGDGRSGEDITQNVRRIRDIKGQVDPSVAKDFEVRGEVYMRISRFKETYEAEFANPRNLAAGALKQKEASKSEAYQLSFFPYDIRGTRLESEREKFDLLTRLGFNVPPLVFDGDFKAVVKDLFDKRDKIDFEIDGVVFRVDSIAEQARLGETAHHPRFAIAYKFQGESAQTHLVDVEWSVGRTGVITPVAIVKPVFVSGATVTRASLHNVGLFRKHQLSQNALVEIVRRGGVIPHVERVLRSEGEILLPPENCPSCGKRALVDGDFLRCSVPAECEQIQVGRILHYCSVLDIEGFGEKWVRVLIERKLVKSLADLYRLKKEDLLVLDRMGPVLAAKMADQIEEKREVELWQFLCALGFAEIGPVVARALVQHFESIEAMRTASKEEIMTIFGVGESIADALIEGFALFATEVDDLLGQVRFTEKVAQAAGDVNHPLFGKSVVFTGKMAYLDRKEAQKRVLAVGGQTPSSVSASTDYVVIGDDGSALLKGGVKSTKHKTAEKLVADGASVRIISETEFLGLLTGG